MEPPPFQEKTSENPRIQVTIDRAYFQLHVADVCGPCCCHRRRPLVSKEVVSHEETPVRIASYGMTLMGGRNERLSPGSPASLCVATSARRATR